jgi:hypothetical protein
MIAIIETLHDLTLKHDATEHLLFNEVLWLGTSTINRLVGGALTILKNMKVNGKDDIPYMTWKNKIHVPNHQPDRGFSSHVCQMVTHRGSAKQTIQRGSPIKIWNPHMLLALISQIFPVDGSCSKP